MAEKQEIQIKITEQTVLKNELATLKTGRRVYQQQQNSNVYFLSDKNQCQQDCQKSISMSEKQLRQLSQ